MSTKKSVKDEGPQAKPVALKRACCHCHGWKDLMVWILMVGYVLLCPFTKVEESFNLQACHDLLFAPDLTQFDHHEFPGVVPRTFLGPLAISSVLKPLQVLLDRLEVPLLSHHLSSAPDHDKLLWQAAVRIVLGTLTVLAWSSFRKALCGTFGPSVCTCFAVLTCAQFHFLFYASRTLPNTFALILALFACANWLQNRMVRTIALLVFAGVVFRSELVLLLAPLVLEQLIRGRLRLFPTFLVGVLFAVMSLLLTLGIDSYFWNRPWLWPEGEVFFFNAVQNKSHEWGVMPWHWYLSNALPKALLVSLPLAFVGLLAAPAPVFALLRPALVFVALYSFLPHKELRFVIYVLPVLTAAAAVGLAWLSHKMSSAGSSGFRRFLWTLLWLGVVAGILLSLCLTAGFAWAAANNYPGGQALRTLHQIGGHHTRHAHRTTVHIDAAAAMTGVSRFGQLHSANWVYSKEEGLSDQELASRGFSFLLTEHQQPISDDYVVVAEVDGFSHLDIKVWPPRIVLTPQIFIQAHKSLH